MARTTKIFSVSLPPKMAKKVEQFCVREELTKSEFFRDAIKGYFESWIETVKVQRMFPHLKNDARIATDDYKKGRSITVERFLKEEGYAPNSFESRGKKRLKTNT